MMDSDDEIESPISSPATVSSESERESESGVERDGEDEDQAGEAAVGVGRPQQRLGLLPYQYEPDAAPPASGAVGGEEVQGRGDDNEPSRLGNNNWCQCGNCVPMPTTWESLCCHEADPVLEKVEQYNDRHADAQINCITAHPGFSTVCLDE
ncbi:uncharacterized protein [Diadema antillarum]|uniref:uncharacterized protein n=1 Tax=Diadema antillarum TaxID=105358 RepID=UPI003A8B9CB6